MASIARRVLLQQGLLVAAMLFASRAHADSVDDVLKELTKARSSLKTLVCSFTQERVLSLFASTITSKGELSLVRPDRLRWELFPPDSIIYWVTPEGIAYRSPQGAGKVSSSAAGALASVLDDILVVLGGDMGTLRSRYDITFERATSSLTLHLAPQKPEVAKIIQRLTIVLESDLQSPRSLVLEEPGGDRSSIQFTDVKKNVDVDPARMKPN